MKIETMTMGDYDEVYKLWLSTPGMGLNDLDDSREGIHRYLSRNPSTCFVARDENGIQGVILCGHDGRRGYIYHTAVAAAKQKQGIGTQLVRAALEAFREEQIHKVVLVVFSKNSLGNSFWEKQGFTVRKDLNYRNMALTELQRIDT